MGYKKNKIDIVYLEKLKNEFESKINKSVYLLIVNFLVNNSEKIKEIITSFESLFIIEDKQELKEYEKFLDNYDVVEQLIKIPIDYETEYYDVFTLAKNIREDDYFKSWNEWLILLFFTIQFLSIEKNLPKEYPNRLESYVLNINNIFTKFKSNSFSNLNDKQKAIFELLEHKLNYILLKLDLLIEEKIDNINLHEIIILLDKTSYKEVKDILIFYKKDKHSKIDEVSKLYLNDVNKDKKNPLDYYFLVKYYKDTIEDETALENLFKDYKKDYWNKEGAITNVIFIWNNLLSFYTKHNNWDYDIRIEKLYKELDKMQKWAHKNYFTYLKYAEYKIKLLGKFLSNDKNIWEAEKCHTEIKNIKNIIVSIYESWSFFELPKEESFVINNNEEIKDDIPKIYCPNLIKIDEKYKKDIRVERLDSKIDYLEFIINQNKNLIKQVDWYKKEITSQFDDTRNKQIEVLAIFSAIVLFVSWTIQLYTRLDDLESAIIFTLFFAWVISIMASLVFRTKSIIKWVNLFIAFLLMLLGLFFPYIWQKTWFKNKTLNINLIDQKLSQLENYTNIIDSNSKK